VNQGQSQRDCFSREELDQKSGVSTEQMMLLPQNALQKIRLGPYLK
jgi:hypothetical protein